jgi:5-carboxymethyl-2-hydroxymuconate isomerase
MPHIIIEYSANLDDSLDIRALVDDLHAAALATGLAEVPALRTRVERREIYKVAEGNPANGFVHVTARLREGRSDEQRRTLGQSLLEATNKRLERAYANHPIALTVEVHEIDPDMTFRRNTIREKAEKAA